MFGYGRHLCPGRDLAKLEMFLFLKTFLAEFDYRVVEGQVRTFVWSGEGMRGWGCGKRLDGNVARGYPPTSREGIFFGRLSCFLAQLTVSRVHDPLRE